MVKLQDLFLIVCPPMILFCFWSSSRKGLCVWIDYKVVCDFLFMVNYRLFRPFLSAAAPPASYGCTESPCLQRHGLYRIQLCQPDDLRCAGCEVKSDLFPIRRHCLPDIGRQREQRADASTGHAEAFAADSCSDLLVFLLDMNNAPFMIDSVFISLSLIKGAYKIRKRG